ncbi:unnamed protein product [Ectocarpus sp. 6 AP-2014]
MRSATTSTLFRGAQRTRGTPLLSLGALRTSGYREGGVRLMMAAEPAEDSVAEAAAAAAAAEEPSISEGEEAVEDEASGGGDGETEVVAEEGEGKEGEKKDEEEEEEEEVDPMAEVKQQIKDLEKELMKEENRLRDVQDSVQEKGQMGFLRMAAQVDNFRKSSGAGTGDYEADAKGAVLRAMLPAFEPFEAAEEALNLETETEVKYNKSYQALYRQLKDVFTKIGATDFFGVVGEKFVYTRHEKASEEHNPVMKEGLIIKCVSPGLELKKNVIRKAVCVVSLGPEKKEEPKEEKEEETAPAAAAAAAAAEGEAAAEAEAEAEAEEPPPMRDAGVDAAAPEGEQPEGEQPAA